MNYFLTLFVTNLRLLQISACTSEINLDDLKHTYDFIIVGGGTAGCVLAARLSEITSWNILLVEAGGEAVHKTDLPMLATNFQKTRLDWNYPTLYQKHCCQFQGGKMYWPVGKVLGGTSEINYMVYTRGCRSDYENWAKLGNSEWSWDKVEPYFKKIERKYYIEHPYSSRVTSIFLNGSKELDFKSNFSRIDAFLHKGKRESTYTAYLKPACSRKNLHILTGAFVTKIIINLKTKTTIGIKLKKNNQKIRVNSKREVILSAGVVGTVKLMLLSGIGPKKLLKQMQIIFVKNLPVGKNVTDHIAYFGLNYLTDISLSEDKKHLYLNQNSKQLARTKFESSTAGFESVGFLRLSEESKQPDVELLASNFLTNKIWNVSGVATENYKKFFKEVEDKATLSVFPVLLHPKSKGVIKLLSKDPKMYPAIIPNYLKLEEDVETIAKAIEIVQKIMKPLNSHAALYPMPICENHHYQSFKYWKCAVKKLTMSFGDYTGGCKMGSESDNTAVVNQDLTVKGVEKLRIVDASVMPDSVSGHLAGPVVMISEKAADIIKNKHKSE